MMRSDSNLVLGRCLAQAAYRVINAINYYIATMLQSRKIKQLVLEPIGHALVLPCKTIIDVWLETTISVRGSYRLANFDTA